MVKFSKKVVFLGAKGWFFSAGKVDFCTTPCFFYHRVYSRDCFLLLQRLLDGFSLTFLNNNQFFIISLIVVLVLHLNINLCNCENREELQKNPCTVCFP